MSLTPFFEAELAVQIHIICALMALVLGAAVLFRRKGGWGHKISGRVWFALMAGVALSGFFIHQIKTFGPFSALHLFSVITLASLVWALVSIRRGDVLSHQLTLKALYCGGLVFAGSLTLARDLVMHRIVFGEGNGFIPALRDLPGGVFGVTFGGALLIAIGFGLFGGSERRKSS